MEKDYYQIIGIRNDASQNEIKGAYRKKAQFLHPDKNTDKETLSKMKELNSAYEILKNPQKRAEYDLNHLFQESDNHTFYEHAGYYPEKSFTEKFFYDEWKEDGHYRKAILFLWLILGFLLAFIVASYFFLTSINRSSSNLKENNSFPEDLNPKNEYEQNTPNETNDIIREI